MHVVFTITNMISHDLLYSLRVHGNVLKLNRYAKSNSYHTTCHASFFYAIPNQIISLIILAVEESLKLVVLSLVTNGLK